MRIFSVVPVLLILLSPIPLPEKNEVDVVDYIPSGIHYFGTVMGKQGPYLLCVDESNLVEIFLGVKELASQGQWDGQATLMQRASLRKKFRRAECNTTRYLWADVIGGVLLTWRQGKYTNSRVVYYVAYNSYTVFLISTH